MIDVDQDTPVVRLSQRPPMVGVVVQQHVEDAAILHASRTSLTHAPHARLFNLKRFDDRLAAHLDGLAIAGTHCVPLLDATLIQPSSGVVFVSTVRALETRDEGRLQRLSALTDAVTESKRGFLSAFGWLEPAKLRGIMTAFLKSTDGLRRVVGITASSLHRVDPGVVTAIEDQDPHVRARAWRTAGELGKIELVSTAADSVADEDAPCRFWAAWASVLLGDRERGVETLLSIAEQPGPFQRRAFQLALQAMTTSDADAWLRRLAKPENVRPLIRGAGLVGDPKYVPWFIAQMADDRAARLAGEAFSLVTGVNLAWIDLERKPPEGIQQGPTDDPADPNVEMDEDEGLPFPDPMKVQAWWEANAHQFQPGVRYFMGAPLSREHCLEVLKEGFQRQRITAALYVSLLTPGSKLFEWRAPARRQERLLAQMS